MRGYKAHTVRDQIRFLATPARLRVPAFSVIHRLEHFTPGEQLLGTALALIAMCEGAAIPLRDVLTVASNVIDDVAGPFTSHIQAVRAYAAGEIARNESGFNGRGVM